MSKNEMQHKIFSFDLIEAKEVTRDGQKFGIIKGYASTYGNIDRGGDVVEKGAFSNSIARHKQTNRPITMLLQHSGNNIIGGFPIDQVQDDEKGLFMEGEINLDVQAGNEAYALAKQGVLSDLSIGFSVNDADVDDHGIMHLKELELWEVSLVSEPMNPEAVITDVKAVTPFQNLPLASRDTVWAASEAKVRVRKETDSVDVPSVNYRKGFFWYDAENADKFGAYKLPYADVIDGSLKAVPRAIFNAAARLNQTDISDADKTRVANNINKYYDKMGLDSPLKNADLAEHYKIFAESLEELNQENQESVKDINEFECMKDVESYFKNPFRLSSSQRKILISKIKSFSREVEDVAKVRDVHTEIKERLELALIENKVDKITKLFNRR